MSAKAVKKTIAFLVVLCLWLTLASCKPAQPEETLEGEAEMVIQVTSTAFTDGSNIPSKHTCDGKDVSPELAWSGVPQGAKSLAIIMDDPDAPGRVFVHWVLFNIPASIEELPEGVSGIGLPGTNNFRKMGYNGPCPPSGSAHRYFFKLYALDQELKLSSGTSKADLENAMKDHILATGQLTGKYGR